MDVYDWYDSFMIEMDDIYGWYDSIGWQQYLWLDDKLQILMVGKYR